MKVFTAFLPNIGMFFPIQFAMCNFVSLKYLPFRRRIEKKKRVGERFERYQYKANGHTHTHKLLNKLIWSTLSGFISSDMRVIKIYINVHLIDNSNYFDCHKRRIYEVENARRAIICY